MSDITDIVNDLCSVIAFNHFFSEYGDQMPSVSDQLYNDFMIHWGANHCVDLIRAIHLKLNDDFKWHNFKRRESLKK